jgi:hypothetical protein
MYDRANFRRSVRAGTLLAALAVIAAGPLSATAAEAATSPAAVSASSSAKTTPQDQLCLITCGPPSITASWTYDTAPGHIPFSNEPGTITVHGTGFPPGDRIVVSMETAGGLYTLSATASEPHWFCYGRLGCEPILGGVFTVSQPDVKCGPNLSNLPGGDSVAYAQDQQNEAVNPAPAAVATGCPDLGILCRRMPGPLVAAGHHVGQRSWCQKLSIRPERDALDIRLAQKNAWENKLAKGFNTTDVPLEFCLLVSEVGEAFDAWRKAPEQVSQELADIAIFLFGLAEMTGTDLQEAVESKLAVNQARVYRKLRDGVHVKETGC